MLDPPARQDRDTWRRLCAMAPGIFSPRHRPLEWEGDNRGYDATAADTADESGDRSLAYEAGLETPPDP